jgi:hypothetical protein
MGAYCHVNSGYGVPTCPARTGCAQLYVHWMVVDIVAEMAASHRRIKTMQFFIDREGYLLHLEIHDCQQWGDCLVLGGSVGSTLLRLLQSSKTSTKRVASGALWRRI